MVEKSYSSDFKYTHKNPYHGRLESFDDFVLTDHSAEGFRGSWCRDVFKRSAPIYLEIGSGYGHFMLDHCRRFPEVNFIGLDYRFKRSHALAKQLDRISDRSFRYLRAKGERISFLFAPGELDRIYYFFPDPWPKTRQRKKRLFNTHFLPLAHQALRDGGEIYIKTDHREYFDQMLKVVLEHSDLFEITLSSTDLRSEYSEHFLCSFVTKFEQIFLEQQLPINALVLKARK
ncbi:MAG: tRNA (guanosine(46)-N7)-methyltransferase TrmB [Bdellovibrionales bacterium]|jgi:tRNA (guanine-N7-)-methyltransferase|nr:tRNA (guanosine(46)-N7)-methyltransferase TrmB [Bdellovibrionales bacterium]MBT3526926.1 tRNA (guanosine(46)-N7)-methyltransferase TrmB [Bdellovibrionales bacterium]MBT7669394.1 tRNA (guanosine(46)-N7)-methyltransferase TrmB [Bdellovibrionales bacterium]